VVGVRPIAAAAGEQLFDWPKMVAVQGQDNTLGMPIYLPPLDTEGSKIVGGDEEVVLTMKDVPGARTLGS
jgi:hypothetical protein